MFLDKVTLKLKAGDGGAGVVAFRREKYVPFGGPAGGDGGRGGNVVLRVTRGLNTLSKYQRKREYEAERGSNGGNFNRTGASANDLILDVPPGTIVRDADSGAVIADLTRDHPDFIAVEGGRGGRGNARFKSSTHQSPRIAERGEPGKEKVVELELRLIADVAIIGVPNAGKSTLLSVLSSATPKIAEYPFTTISPNLGVAKYDDQELVFADVPGLIEGAHDGVGLGLEFLRHIRRTRMLIHLLDGASADPFADYVMINSELNEFDPAQAEKPQLVVLNKSDLPDSEDVLARIRKNLSPHMVLSISAKTHFGLSELVQTVLKMLPPDDETTVPAIIRPETDEDTFEIRREGDSFRVTGSRIERTAAMTYWEFDEAVERFQRILTAMGIADALRHAGAKKGDTVLIGDYELEWAE